jgi:hypothetical protein
MKRAAHFALLALAVVLLGAAILWNPVAEPLLVRFPTDLDQTIRYEGTFEVAADPATLTPLPEPLTLPLKVFRRIHVVDSSFRTVVVREDITMKVGDMPAATDLVSHEFDRRTMRHVDGPDSWAFERSHAPPRRDTYRINFPLNTENGRTYRMWSNETDTQALLSGGTPGRVRGIDVLRFEGGVDDKAHPAYTRALVEKGFAPGKDYEYWCNDNVAVEPRTGSIVAARSVESVRVRNADGSAQTVYTARFAQTPSSVTEVADEVKSQLRTLRIVQVWAPLVLLGAGLSLLVVGGLLGRGRRGTARRPATRPVPVHA